MESALTRYRRENGILQADLAAQLGVHPPAVCKWERGRVPAERVLAVCALTGLNPHDLRPDIYPREYTWQKDGA